MNARDNIRPKSIRLSILTALASGAITTIDDLLIAVEETRAKVTNNAQAAYHDGLIKRMRDDVTGLAAYQITPAGKKHLAKYADGSKAEPVAEPVVRENQTTEVPTCQESRQVAQATKKAEAVAVKVFEEAMPGFTAEVVAQKDNEIASLSRRLRDALAFARGGKRAQVFALVAIGTAVPGAEWKE